MVNKKISNDFIESLVKIYNLDVINLLLEFVQGEQAVLFAIYLSNVNTASKLAEKLNVSKSRMTFIINNLIKKNYLTTYQNEEDKRIKHLKLTSQGASFIREREHIALTVLNIYVEKMGKDKIKNLTELLNDTAKIMEMEEE